MNPDPREVIADSPMSALQIIAVALTVGLNALDGFDVLSISFASPGIAQEWGIDRAALGVVLSMELIGMAIGSIVLGGVADAIGRRPTILGCLAVMAGGMLAATTAAGLVDLCLARRHRPWDRRHARGDQRGAAEFSNRRRRHLSVADVDRLSARCGVRRHRGSATTAGPRLAGDLILDPRSRRC
jgi:hypothetical protein